MLNQGQTFTTKAAAKKKAESMRRKGFKAYIRRALVAKPGHIPATKRSDQKLVWLATWER